MAKLSAFGQAFKEARERGDAEFEFNGKRYHTRRADEVSAPAAKPAAKPTPKAEPAPQPKAAPATEAAAEEPRRKTVFPAGSLMGRIAMSQGAESTFPEPTETPTGRAQSDEGSKLMRNLGKYFGSEETRRRIREEDEMTGMAKGGKVSSASRRGDGIAQRGKTKGRMV